MSILLGWIKDILFSILLWLVLFPIVMILATPVILSISIFGKMSITLLEWQTAIVRFLTIGLKTDFGAFIGMAGRIEL